MTDAAGGFPTLVGQINNSAPNPILLFLEPWPTEHQLQPGTGVEVVATGDSVMEVTLLADGNLEIIVVDGQGNYLEFGVTSANPRPGAPSNG